jgi:SAM-dependent methyltransferase
MKTSTQIKNLGNRFLKFVGVPGWQNWSDKPEMTMISTISSFMERHKNSYINTRETNALDIGCGLNPVNPFGADHIYGVDIRGNKEIGVVAADLFVEPIPFKDGFFDFVTAHNFIEHIPRVVIADGRTRFPFVESMNEIYRILKPGGLFFSQTPAYPAAEAFQDPTHVNIITENTFPLYFCNNHLGEPWASMYGYAGDFELVEQEWCQAFLLTIIKKL